MQSNQFESPLEPVRIKGVPAKVFLKREDLNGPVGGNKVRRFNRWFALKGTVKRVLTLSDPGAHTFYVLSHYLKGLSNPYGPESMIFLERKRSIYPYMEKLRNHYFHKKGINVMRASLPVQLGRYLVHKTFRLSSVVGIGGHMKLTPNPFEAAFRETQNQLKNHKADPNAHHVFPLASGMMLDGFLEESAMDESWKGGFHAALTGDALSQPLQNAKYGRNRNVTLHTTRPFPWETYLEKNEELL